MITNWINKTIQWNYDSWYFISCNNCEVMWWMIFVQLFLFFSSFLWTIFNWMVVTHHYMFCNCSLIKPKIQVVLTWISIEPTFRCKSAQKNLSNPPIRQGQIIVCYMRIIHIDWIFENCSNSFQKVSHRLNVSILNWILLGSVFWWLWVNIVQRWWRHVACKGAEQIRNITQQLTETIDTVSVEVFQINDPNQQSVFKTQHVMLSVQLVLCWYWIDFTNIGVSSLCY